MVETLKNSRGLELERKRMGSNFLGILNDLKRRPEDAAKELGVSLAEINSIIEGKQELPFDLVSKAIRIWPVNARDFFIVRDDCETGIKIMTATGLLFVAINAILGRQNTIKLKTHPRKITTEMMKSENYRY